MARLGLIVARGRNGVIGRDGGLPWRLSSDLKGFKTATLGCPVITGRRNQEAMGRLLPGRATLVVTRDADWRLPGAWVFSGLDVAIPAALAMADASGAPFAWVIGGGEVYAQALPHADLMRITEVDASPDGDTFFVTPDMSGWTETGREAFSAGPKDDHGFEVLTWERRRGAPLPGR